MMTALRGARVAVLLATVFCHRPKVEATAAVISWAREGLPHSMPWQLLRPGKEARTVSCACPQLQGHLLIREMNKELEKVVQGREAS